jgi:hypothetical protein
VSNTAKTPVTPATPLVIEMPSGAQGTTLFGEQQQPATVDGTRVTLTGPFQSGQTPVGVSYRVPFSGSDLNLTQTFPVPVSGVAVMMRKIGPMAIRSPQFTGQEERLFEGQTYVLGQGGGVAAGGTLTLDIDGLPHHSAAPRLIALGLAGTVIVLGAFAASRPRAPRANDAAALKARREKIFTDLIRLEQQRRAAGPDASRYGERRSALITQLERIYRDLDAGGEGLPA